MYWNYALNRQFVQLSTPFSTHPSVSMAFVHWIPKFSIGPILPLEHLMYKCQFRFVFEKRQQTRTGMKAQRQNIINPDLPVNNGCRQHGKLYIPNSVWLVRSFVQNFYQLTYTIYFFLFLIIVLS